MAIENMEQRMIALKYMGADLLKHVDSELLDTGIKPCIHYDYNTETKKGKGRVTYNELFVVRGVFSDDRYFLKYEDPSTGREYISGVPNEIGEKKDADLAMAWKFYMTKEEYLSLENEA